PEPGGEVRAAGDGSRRRAMSRSRFASQRAALVAGAFATLAALGGSSPSAQSQEAVTLAALAARAAALEREIGLIEDEKAVEKLQRIYGFYTDKQLWTQAADLFADNGTIEVGGRGVYVGRDRVLALLKQNGPEFPQPGRLFDQMQLQPVVHVAADGRTAKGRWHMFAQEAVHGEYARWGLGIFENDYVKEGGVWKIQRLHLYATMYTPYEDGWAKTALPNEGPSSSLPPDRPPSVEYAMRGVYVGSASVRRNLNLYGQATDSQFGLQHNHMQFQPVIDVAPDGQSAKMRSRALSIMGQWQRYSQWMGGVYENEYVKENGVWKIKHDQVFNTYFVPYTVGWKTVMPRPPPGTSDTNPPDLPPSLPFEMYPKP